MQAIFLFPIHHNSIKKYQQYKRMKHFIFIVYIHIKERKVIFLINISFCPLKRIQQVQNYFLIKNHKIFILTAKLLPYSLIIQEQISNNYISSKSKNITLPMLQQKDSVNFTLGLSVLKAYVTQQTQKIIDIHHLVDKQYKYIQQNDLNVEIIEHSKKVCESINLIVFSIKDFLTDIGLDFVYDFYHLCQNILIRNSKELSQMVMNRYNQILNISTYHKPIIISKINNIECATNEHQNLSKDDTNKSKRAFQGIEYYLNLLIHEQNKSYNEYKSQCQKLLLQRQIIENIKPSQACKHIAQANILISDIIQQTDTMFKDIYLIKQIQLKTNANNIEIPQKIQEIFKEELDKSLRSKFQNGINSIIQKHNRYTNQIKKKNQRNYSTQTEQNQKYKCQQKLQLLLINEKKINQKLKFQLQKNKNEFEKSAQKFQKTILNNNNLTLKQKKQSVRTLFRINNQPTSEILNDAMKKYLILQSMYNQKCQELQKIKYKNQPTKEIIKYIQPTPKKTDVSSSQTDKQFYYYYQNLLIKQQEQKIRQLQKIINHKDYVIEEMSAIRTFRDNFKSKAQLFSTVIKRTDKKKINGTLHYLDQSDQYFDPQFQLRKEISIQNTSQHVQTKKKVTMNILSQQITSNQSFMKKKRQKKRAETNKNKLYFALGDKVEQQQNIQNNKSKMNTNQSQFINVSIKSILKQKNLDFKKQAGVQTQQIQGKYLNSVDNKNRTKNIALRSSLSSKADNNIEYFNNSSSNYRKSQTKQFSKTGSNFKNILMMIKEPIQSDSQRSNDISQLNVLQRTFNNKITSTKRETSQNKYVKQKIETQVLHVNNSLNLNFGQILDLSKKGSKDGMKMKIQPLTKIKKMKKV